MRARRDYDSGGIAYYKGEDRRRWVPCMPSGNTRLSIYPSIHLSFHPSIHDITSHTQVMSIGPQICVASSTPSLMDVCDVKSGHDYFELLQRGGVIDKQHYTKNGVGSGIATFNMVLNAVRSSRDNAGIRYEDFGTVCTCALVFCLLQQKANMLLLICRYVYFCLYLKLCLLCAGYWAARYTRCGRKGLVAA